VRRARQRVRRLPGGFGFQASRGGRIMGNGDEIDYGPLARLLGTWEGDRGLDVAPEPDGTEENPYFETIAFSPVGDVTNAESQTLAAVRYQQIVSRKSDKKVFHDQTGYWMWDAREGVIMQSIVIPRAVCVLAGGRYDASGGHDSPVELAVSARLGDPDWGIIQSPFMRDKARTVEFRHDLTVDGKTLSYSETTVLEIYGRTFEHTDENQLTPNQS
jgi:hypothetical protein